MTETTETCPKCGREVPITRDKNNWRELRDFLLDGCAHCRAEARIKDARRRAAVPRHPNAPPP